MNDIDKLKQKILLNTYYPISYNKDFKLYDENISQEITKTGQNYLNSISTFIENEHIYGESFDAKNFFPLKEKYTVNNIKSLINTICHQEK